MTPSLKEQIVARVEELAGPIVSSEGLVLVEVSWGRDRGGWVLRLFVDRPGGGVTLEECAVVSRQVGDLLDVEDFIDGPYRLEVSSPGLSRRFKSEREYEIFAGRRVKLVVSSPEGTSLYRGRLKGLQGGDVIIEVDGRIKAVPLGQVARANLDEQP